MQFHHSNDCNILIFDLHLGFPTSQRDATKFPIFVAIARFWNNRSPVVLIKHTYFLLERNYKTFAFSHRESNFIWRRGHLVFSPFSPPGEVGVIYLKYKL